jgi:hypothetical protein
MVAVTPETPATEPMITPAGDDCNGTATRGRLYIRHHQTPGQLPRKL